MKDCPRYTSYQVQVTFAKDKVICKPNVLEIPANTIATVTWYPKACGEFLFLQFEWLKKNGFLSQDPIIHDQCVIAAVNNTGPHTDGDWLYLFKIQVGDCVHHTSTKPGITGVDGQPKIHTH